MMIQHLQQILAKAMEVRNAADLCMACSAEISRMGVQMFCWQVADQGRVLELLAE